MLNTPDTIRDQRGAASILVVIFLIAVVFTILLFSLRAGQTSIHGTLAQQDSIEALFLAESGIERVAQLFGSGIPCDASLITSHNLGGGGFSITAVASTDFDAVTALPVNQCRVQVTGTISNSNVKRIIEAIVQQGSGAAGIVFDAVSNRAHNGITSLRWNHTVSATGLDRMLLVGVSYRDDTGQSLVSVTYDSVAMTQVAVCNHPTDNIVVEHWQLVAPNTGNNQIEVLATSSIRASAGALSFTGVDQTTPVEASNAASGTSTSPPPSVTVSSLSSNAWVVDGVVTRDSNLTVGAGQTELWNTQTTAGGGGFRIRGAASYTGPVVTSGPQTMTWNLVASTPNWCSVASVVKRGGGSPAQVVSWRETP